MPGKQRTTIAAATLIVVVAAAAWSGRDGPDAGSGASGAGVTLDDAGVEEALEPWVAHPPDAGEEGSAQEEPADAARLHIWAQPDLPEGFEDAVAALPDVTAVVTTRRGLVHLHASWDPDGARVDELPTGYVVPMQAVALDLARTDLHPDLAYLEPDELALSATAARLRGVGPGSMLDLDGHRLTVGAVLPDEVAGSSEVLLSLELAERFAFARRSVTIRHLGDEDAVRQKIAALLPTNVTARIRSPRDDGTGPLVRSQVDMKQRFGEFAHGPVRADGGFTQDPAWVEANITTARVPILGAITCHRDFIPLVAGALQELEDEGLAHLVDASDYAGCWAPRRIASGRTISKHAWGAAIDLNASTNAYGEEPTLDPRVIEAFRRWGMRWGGDFLVPDGMHFEWYEDPTP
jgi:hypothetical protein